MKYGCSICEEWKCHDEHPPEADFREGAHEDSLVCPDCVINMAVFDADALRRDRDDWKAIAVLNSEKIDQMHGEIACLESMIADMYYLEESTQ